MCPKFERKNINSIKEIHNEQGVLLEKIYLIDRIEICIADKWH